MARQAKTVASVVCSWPEPKRPAVGTIDGRAGEEELPKHSGAQEIVSKFPALDFFTLLESGFALIVAVPSSSLLG